MQKTISESQKNAVFLMLFIYIKLYNLK